MSLPEPFVWKNYNKRTGEGDPSTPMTAESKNLWWSQVRAFVTGYVNPLVAPAIAQVADYINGIGGTQVRDALDARYEPTGAEVRANVYADGAVEELRIQTASTEDLFVTADIIARNETITASGSHLAFVAPFPLEVISASLVNWQAAAPAPSDANYWTIQVRRQPAGAAESDQRVIAAKMTKTTGGEPIGRRKAWMFDAQAFTGEAVCAAGDIVSVAFLPTGTAPTLGGVVATIGYRPL